MTESEFKSIMTKIRSGIQTKIMKTPSNSSHNYLLAPTSELNFHSIQLLKIMLSDTKLSTIKNFFNSSVTFFEEI